MANVSYKFALLFPRLSAAVLLWLTVVAVCLLLLQTAASTFSTLNGKRPINIAHRGSSGTHPESTAGAYRKAAESGADYLECDVQATKDDVLICSHDPNLSFLTTDIEKSEFRSRFKAADRKEEVVDMLQYSDKSEPTKRKGWFIPDYSWKDIKVLHGNQAVIERGSHYDGLFPLVKLDELIDIAVETHKGIYLESKHSTWYLKTRNKNLPQLLISHLCKRGYCEINLLFKDGKAEGKAANAVSATADFKIVKPSKSKASKGAPAAGADGVDLPTPLFLQTFCYDDLVYWHRIGATDFMPTTALVWYVNSSEGPMGYILHRVKDDGTDRSKNSASGNSNSNSNSNSNKNGRLEVRPVNLNDLRELKVGFIGADKELLLKNSNYVADAHSKGFRVHVWTFRNENGFIVVQNAEGKFTRADLQLSMDERFNGDPYEELLHFVMMGVDGLFCDHPATLTRLLSDIECRSSSNSSGLNDSSCCFYRNHRRCQNNSNAKFHTTTQQ